jgi:dipeptidyl aminopeptidase/acylaminoacyl peptidase
MKTKQRFAGIQFGNEENAVVMDSWYDTRSQKTYFLNPKTGENKEIADRNYQDVYADPGNFQTDKNEFGQYVISIKNGKAHLIGDGFTKDGQFPLLMNLILKLPNQRLYTSKTPNVKEDIIDIIDANKGTVLVTQQSKNQYPNYF